MSNPYVTASRLAVDGGFTATELASTGAFLVRGPNPSVPFRAA
jgi:uncharacterized protein YaaQ